MRKFKLITAFLFLIAWMPLISEAQVKPITGTILDSRTIRFSEQVFSSSEQPRAQSLMNQENLK